MTRSFVAKIMPLFERYKNKPLMLSRNQPITVGVFKIILRIVVIVPIFAALCPKNL
jgi:hypothetical protein